MRKSTTWICKLGKIKPQKPPSKMRADCMWYSVSTRLPWPVWYRTITPQVVYQFDHNSHRNWMPSTLDDSALTGTFTKIFYTWSNFQKRLYKSMKSSLTILKCNVHQSQWWGFSNKKACTNDKFHCQFYILSW